MKKKLILFSVVIATMSAIAASSETHRAKKGERISDFMNYAAHKLKTEESVIIQMN